MKISDLIKVYLNVFFSTGCGSFPDFSTSWSSEGPRSQTDLKKSSRSTPLKRDLCFMVCMLCYLSRTWMVGFKRLRICQNFCFYFKAKLEKRRAHDCFPDQIGRRHPPATRGPGPWTSAQNPTWVTHNLQYWWTSAVSVQNLSSSGLL